MRKTNIFYRIISLLIVLASIITVFTACGNGEEKKPEEEKKDLLDISGYAIVRYDASDNSISKKTARLKTAIKNTLGLDLAVQTDWYNPNTPPDPNAQELLVEQTNRKESSDALAKLEGQEGDAYVIDITENKIAIVGKTDNSTLRGIAYFIKNYVMTSPEGSGLDIGHGKNTVQAFDSKKSLSNSVLDLDIDLVSTVFAVPEKNPSNLLGYPSNISDVHFPSIIELKYQQNEKNNGILIGAFCIIETAVTNPLDTLACIMESRDGGQNWEVIARPRETIDTGTGWAGSMAHIYELPAQVGNMPAGTLIYSSNSVNYERASHIGVWKSNDCGKSWKEISIVARGGGLGLGVWEPVMFYNDADGYLYCFYSDDFNRKYDQRIVYRRSKDGINWESVVEVCAFGTFADRPGMPVITKMGNGEYFLVYEYCIGGGAKIYYKKTKDITKWDPTDPGTLIETKVGNKVIHAATAPSCLWTPAGGENGTLFVTGMYQFGGDGKNRIFVSGDYGKTWDTLENPLPYSGFGSFHEETLGGYRAIMVTGADPSVIHYINTTNVSGTKRSQIQYAKLKIFE